MKPRHLCQVGFAWLIIGPWPCSFAQEKNAPDNAREIESKLKEVMLENIKGTEAEDVDGTMKTVHSKSPLFQATRKQLSQLFGKHLALKYDLVSLKYLAIDGDFAFARVRLRTTQAPPSNFKSKETDILVAFRKENGTWKFWNQVVLDIQFLKP